MELFENIFNTLLFEESLKENLFNENKLQLDEIKLWFGCCDAYSSMDNPLSLKWENPIDESLIKTYSIETAKQHICKYFNLPEKFFNIYKTKYNTYCFITFPEKYSSLEDIIKAMKWYGYVCSIKNPKPLENGWYVLKFESLFETNANDILKKETHLIHLTPTKNVNKILKKGFIPKSTNNKFEYNDRTYFMLGSTNPIETLKLANSLKNTKYGNEEKVEYCAFRIDVKKIPNNVIFHLDPNMNGAIWTNDNLTPQAIQDYKIFTV